jgi:hypothetical protein
MKKLFIAQPYDAGIDRLRGTVSQQQSALQMQAFSDAYWQSVYARVTDPNVAGVPWNKGGIIVISRGDGSPSVIDGGSA